MNDFLTTLAEMEKVSPNLLLGLPMPLEIVADRIALGMEQTQEYADEWNGDACRQAWVIIHMLSCQDCQTEMWASYVEKIHETHDEFATSLLGTLFGTRNEG